MRGVKTYMETKYHKKLEDMSYDELLLMVCNYDKKEFYRVKARLKPIEQKIYKWGRSLAK